MRELLAPIEQTFVLCGMEYLPPFVAHGAHGMTAAQIDRCAQAYRRAIEALRDERFDFEAARSSALLGVELDEWILPGDGGDGAA